MPVCSVCSHDKAKEINRVLLTRGNVSGLAREYKLCRGSVWNHYKKHLPWRSRRAKKPETILEELELMELELRRLMVLAECGQPISGAIQALGARRAVLELRARLEGRLDSTHRKLALASKPIDYEVTFENGKMRTVEAAK